MDCRWIERREQGGRAITTKDFGNKQKPKGLHLIRIPYFEFGLLNTVRGYCTLDLPRAFIFKRHIPSNKSYIIII